MLEAIFWKNLIAYFVGEGITQTLLIRTFYFRFKILMNFILARLSSGRNSFMILYQMKIFNFLFIHMLMTVSNSIVKMIMENDYNKRKFYFFTSMTMVLGNRGFIRSVILSTNKINFYLSTPTAYFHFRLMHILFNGMSLFSKNDDT